MPEGDPPEVPSFTWGQSKFYDTLKERLKAYFNGRSHKAPYRKWIRMLGLVLSFFALLPKYWAGEWWTLPCLGFHSFILGTFILHDSTHTTLSDRPWVNYLCATFSTLFGSMHPICWSHSHIVGHHLYTNVEGFDIDSNYAEFGGIRWRPWWFRHLLMNTFAIVWPAHIESSQFRYKKRWPVNGTPDQVSSQNSKLN